MGEGEGSFGVGIVVWVIGRTECLLQSFVVGEVSVYES